MVSNAGMDARLPAAFLTALLDDIVRTLPGKIVDGVGVAPDGRMFASSWETSEVYSVAPDGQVASPFGKLTAPAADFHFDLQRGRILLPLLRANSLMFAPLP